MQQPIHILELNKFDVLSGRGNGTNMQNLEYRYIVSHHVERYRGATKGQRRNIALQVVREVESKGGRFLQKSKHVFLNRLNTDQKLIKVMQSLRDEAKKDKRHSISRSTSNNNAATTTTSPGADVVGTTATTTTTAYRSLEMLNDIVCIDPENNDVPAKKKKKGDPKNDQENLVSCNINNTQQDINQQSCKDSNRLNVAAAAVAVVVVVVAVGKMEQHELELDAVRVLSDELSHPRCTRPIEIRH